MLFIVFIVALQIFFTVGIEFNKDSNVQYIVPTIGTADQHGGMIPSTARPFAMTRWTAMTQENHVGQCPYYNTGTTFYGFLGTHQPAVWMVSCPCFLSNFY
jgi:putative alpha-1,2-mannosidase